MEKKIRVYVVIKGCKIHTRGKPNKIFLVDFTWKYIKVSYVCVFVSGKE